MDGWVEELVRRGVDRPHAARLVDGHDGEQLAGAIAYFDSLPDAGPGLLVLAVREGRRPRRTRTSVLDEQAAYGEQIVAWLRQHFPQYNRSEGNRTHAAAIACVIRLHHRYGRGSLSVREHGAAIRGAVADFDSRMLGGGE